MKSLKISIVTAVFASLLFGSVYAFKGDGDKDMRMGKNKDEMRVMCHEKMMNEMAEDLNLTEDQKSKISQIMEDGWKEIEAEREKMKEKVKAVREKKDAEVEKILNEKQIKAFKKHKEKKMNEMKKMHKNKMKGDMKGDMKGMRNKKGMKGMKECPMMMDKDEDMPPPPDDMEIQ
ncbi:MAG: hypothetical protein ABH857_04740 [Elusimicrobiota bacterium]